MQPLQPFLAWRTLTKLRFSRNALSYTEREAFEILLKEDDYYTIRVSSDVVNPSGKDYVVSSVKAVLPREKCVSYPWNFLFTKCLWGRKRASLLNAESLENDVYDELLRNKVQSKGESNFGTAIESISLDMKQQESDQRCIQIMNLHKVYMTKGKCCAVNSLQLTLYENQILALLGADALHASIAAVSKYGGAVAGYLTMLDALIPAATVLKERLDVGADPLDAFLQSSEASIRGAKMTKQM